MSVTCEWRTGVIVTFVVLSAGITGCSSQPETPSAGAASNSANSIPAKVELSPIDALVPQLSTSDERTLWEAQRKLIRTCMTAQGIDFTFPAWEVSKGREAEAERMNESSATPKLAFANPVWAKAHGYGVSAVALRAEMAKRPGPETGATIDPKTDAALYGGDGPSESGSIVLANGHGTLSYGTTGCHAESLKRLYGNLRQFHQLSEQQSGARQDLHSRVVADVSVSTSLTEWRECMSSHGWSSFKSQGEAFDKVFKAYVSNQSDARNLEFSIAPVDAGCTVSSGYDVAVKAAEKRVAKSASQSMNGMIVSFVELQHKALAIATKILST